MKLSHPFSFLLSYSIGFVNASDDLHTVLESAYPERDLASSRDPYDFPAYNRPAPKIVGGVQVDPKDRYPYQVALTDSSGEHFCGGSLIAPGWVLSAAHCDIDPDLRVQIGRWDLSDSTEEYEDIEVDVILVHPDYDYYIIDNDFMLLKLKDDSQYPPVSIDDGSQNLAPGTDVTTMGWGATNFYYGSPSDVLLEVEVDIVGNDECSLNHFYDVTDNMLCVSRPGKSACYGDSGGPLIIRGNDYSEDVLVGVVSWGIDCSTNYYPGVYARVSKAYDWIREYVSFIPGSEDGSGDEDQDGGSSPDLCNHDEVSFTINIQTDIYGEDTSWRLDMNTRGKYWDLHTRNSGTYESETFHEEDLCIPKDECFTFVINDAANDGLCCNHSRGYYSIYLEGEMVKYSIYGNKAEYEDTVFGTNGRLC